MEVANEKISSLNEISERNYLSQAEEFRRNIRLLANMKKELDSVFRRIRYFSLCTTDLCIVRVF